MLELAGISADVVVTNVISINPPEPRKGSKEKHEIKYLL